MIHSELIDNAYNILLKMHHMPSFSEVYNILNSTPSTSRETYAEICSIIGLEVGESGFAILSENNILKIAALTIVFASLADDFNQYTIFFNQQRENIKISYLIDDLFVFSGIESIKELEPELENIFLNTMNNVDGHYIISSFSIIEILKFYLETENINIAIADYIQGIRINGELLCNFTINDSAFVKNSHSPNIEVLEKIYIEKRLDSYSLDILEKSMKEDK